MEDSSQSQPDLIQQHQKLNNPDLYINRELSLLKFNERVLQQAKDENTPLLERLKFLCIACSNLDEFFEIRVAGIKQHLELSTGYVSFDQMTPQQVLDAIHKEAVALVTEQYRVFNEEIQPALEQQGVDVIPRERWTNEQRTWLRNYFAEQVEPVLSPLGLDPAHPFPRIINKSLNFIVQVEGSDAFGRSGDMAVVQAPRSLPRLIEIPSQNDRKCFVFLSSVIHEFVHELFEGMEVKGCYQFRVTRNSDLFVDDEEIDDLLRALEGELASRKYGAAVRLETADNTPDELVNYLLVQFQLTEIDLYRVNGPVNLNRIMASYDLIDRPDLKYGNFTPLPAAPLGTDVNIFDAITRQDILMFLPFQSFMPVINFIEQAATDPKVLAIKQTLYRTGAKSRIVDALVKGARAGKEVTVVIELMARFDEAANIALANRLQSAGAHVVYGIVGIKTHAKSILVIRREQDKLVRYAHLGTGNYHQGTARLYTDYGFFTRDPVITADLHEIFLQLTSLTKVPKLKKVLQAPFSLYKTLIKLIEEEREQALQGQTAEIYARVNSLVEPQLIQALYSASQAGVKIRLVVRGICCLRPGVESISDNIEVRSIVGRFLEHPRVFSFHARGNTKIYCSSADWMDRNFFRRVEIAWPIEEQALRDRIMEDLELYWRDNMNAWKLQSDGDYKKIICDQDEPVSAQSTLLQRYAKLH